MQLLKVLPHLCLELDPLIPLLPVSRALPSNLCWQVDEQNNVRLGQAIVGRFAPVQIETLKVNRLDPKASFYTLAALYATPE